MLLDKELVLSDAQAITEDAASAFYINTQAAGRAIDELWLVVQVHTTFDTAAEGGTLIISLRTAAAAAGGELTSPTTLFISATFTEAVLVEGYRALTMKLPPGLLQYIDLYYDENDGDSFTAGKLDAFLTPTPDGLGY